MAKILFKTISYLLHPAFMTLFGVVIILTFSHLSLLTFDGKKAIFIMVALTTFLFPLAIVPLFYYQRLITGIEISDRKERLFPIFISAAFYYFGYYILHKYAAPVFLQDYLFAAFLSVLLAALIHLKWKISLHMIGIGGFIGLLSVLSFLYKIQLEWILMGAILMAGLLGTARLYLKEHTHMQIYVGFLTGFILVFGFMVVIK
jgi:hypothetical protein